MIEQWHSCSKITWSWPLKAFYFFRRRLWVVAHLLFWQLGNSWKKGDYACFLLTTTMAHTYRHWERGFHFQLRRQYRPSQSQLFFLLLSRVSDTLKDIIFQTVIIKATFSQKVSFFQSFCNVTSFHYNYKKAAQRGFSKSLKYSLWSSIEFRNFN